MRRYPAQEEAFRRLYCIICHMQCLEQICCAEELRGHSEFDGIYARECTDYLNVMTQRDGVSVKAEGCLKM